MATAFYRIANQEADSGTLVPGCLGRLHHKWPSEVTPAVSRAADALVTLNRNMDRVRPTRPKRSPRIDECNRPCWMRW
jgi:hypothetical protein